jgi:hypothetical protein
MLVFLHSYPLPVKVMLGLNVDNNEEPSPRGARMARSGRCHARSRHHMRDHEPGKVGMTEILGHMAVR